MKEIWDAINQIYLKAKNVAHVYDLKVKIVTTKQENKPITEYANLLKSLWMELDPYRMIKTKCKSRFNGS